MSKRLSNGGDYDNPVKRVPPKDPRVPRDPRTYGPNARGTNASSASTSSSNSSSTSFKSDIKPNTSTSDQKNASDNSSQLKKKTSGLRVEFSQLKLDDSDAVYKRTSDWLATLRNTSNSCRAVGEFLRVYYNIHGKIVIQSIYKVSFLLYLFSN